MLKKVKIIFFKLTNKLWFRPLVISLITILLVFIAQLADDTFITDIAPKIEKKSIEDLLTTLSASMLVIAIFAVGAMVSAYASATNTATPRSFKLVVADDASQNALSVFIGSFIYSIVATIAFQNGFYGKAGYFTLFAFTIIVFIIVIITFLSWVERISKLGRLNNTIKKVEEATTKAIQSRKTAPNLGGAPVQNKIKKNTAVFSDKIGYVQYINMDELQEVAVSMNATFLINCIPGTFTASDKPLIYLISGDPSVLNENIEKINKAFTIDPYRSFHDDPRFGLIALSEIASRALSPGINDPGTAIMIIGSYVRLFSLWLKTDNNATAKIKYDRIQVPEISLNDMLDDAFRPIARDGANNIEVMLRMQKALQSISHNTSLENQKFILSHALEAYQRAELALEFKGDQELLRRECHSEN
ncbi:MAG TPA: DUF2254 domain-containing protein [Chitinophagales bacterium]|nr:DUF2254 domain-containing protein [Chitinophagales bacterium]